MKIIKGTLVNVNHSRKGQFYAIANEDFDTELDEWFPLRIATIQEGGNGESIKGLSTKWNQGELIPCRKGLCRVKVEENDT